MKNKWLLLEIKQGLLCKKWHLSLNKGALFVNKGRLLKNCI